MKYEKKNLKKVDPSFLNPVSHISMHGPFSSEKKIRQRRDDEGMVKEQWDSYMGPETRITKTKINQYTVFYLKRGDN